MQYRESSSLLTTETQEVTSIEDPRLVPQQNTGLTLADLLPWTRTLECQIELLSRRLLGHLAKEERENPSHNVLSIEKSHSTEALWVPTEKLVLGLQSKLSPIRSVICNIRE